MTESNRRVFAATVAGGLAGGCANRARTKTSGSRLRARPGQPEASPAGGARSLNLRAARDAWLYIPESALHDGGAPLVLFLHGAGGDAQRGLRFLTAYAEAYGLMIVAPASEGRTWDALLDDYGPDVRFVDRALEAAFRMCRVAPAKIAVSGFSDGASYALGLGLSNGDLFRHVLAFSPGFVPPGFEAAGRPRVFVSHGTADRVLPIERCSRAIVPKLTQAGYDVTFREFDGGHTLPGEIGEAAIRWFLS